MTTPITAKVVEVPPPERPDLWIGISPRPADDGEYDSTEPMKIASLLLADGEWTVFALPGTRTLAAQAAERERIVAGLYLLASRIIADTSLSVTALNAAIAYIEGRQPAPATDRRGE